jgi:hypothetical protein
MAQKLALPLADLARDHDRVDIGPVHQRHHRARRVVEGRDVDRLGIQQDDVGLLARRQAAGLVVEPQALGPFDRGVPDRLRAGHQLGEILRPAKRGLVGVHPLKRDEPPHLGEEIRRHRAFHVRAQRHRHAEVERLLNGGIP